jgi:hypothetical protein
VNLDALIARLQVLREQTSGDLEVLYLVHSDSEQYQVDSVNVVKADEGIAEKVGFDEGHEYILIVSDNVW